MTIINIETEKYFEISECMSHFFGHENHPFATSQDRLKGK
jgi:hypothetical protein